MFSRRVRLRLPRVLVTAAIDRPRLYRLRAGFVPEADARFLVILLRAAVAAFLPLLTAFFAVDFERFITAAAPTASAPAMAGKSFDILILHEN